MSNKVTKPPITTKSLRVSYPSIFVPRAYNPGDTPKYSIVVLFSKADPDDMKEVGQIYADLESALNEAFPDPATRPRTALVGDTYSPIKDGDVTIDKNGVPYREKNPEYVGHYFLRASTETPPAVVYRNNTPIIGAAEIYGGCYCKVNINVYSYEGRSNRGVTVGLNGVQKWDDGEAFGGGRPSVDQMFTPDTGPSPFQQGGQQPPFNPGPAQQPPFNPGPAQQQPPFNPGPAPAATAF
jgi:hypothetical protein